MNQSTLSTFKRWLAVLSLVVGVAFIASAESVEINGLYYELNTTARTATVTYQTTTTSNYSSLPVEVIIPANVTYNNVTFDVKEIADKAFANCKTMESISIPGSVTKVGTTMYASSDATNLPFYKCTSLKSIRFEDGTASVKLGVGFYNNYTSSVGKGLFYYCPLEEVYLGRNIAYNNYSSGTPFSNYPQNYGYSAFYNQPKLTKVTIGESVTSIPEHIFRNCSSLVEVILGSSLKSVPEYAFNSCNLSKIELPSSVTSIAAYSFQSNTNMQSANLGSAVETIGDYAFDGCTKLCDINLGNALSSIGNYTFQNAGRVSLGWQPLILPETLKSIGDYAFASCWVPKLSMPKSLTSMGQFAFSSNTKLNCISFNGNCSTIPEGALSGCTGLTSIMLPDGIIEIADKAFANCTSLESISIPGSVTKVGTTMYASSDATNLPFYKCTSLKSIRFEDGTASVKLGVGFYNNYTSSVGKGLFYYCPLEEVYLGRNIAYTNYSSGTPFSNYPQNYGYSAFYNQPKLTKVTIGTGCTELTDYLFYNNASITLMTLPNVAKIGNHTFDGCSKLTTLNLGNLLQSVGNYAFNGCSNVTKLTFPNTTTTIGDNAFYNCSSVAEITIGSGLRTIGRSAFYNCKSFTALILPDSFTTMGESAFENCAKLTVAKLGITLDAVPAKAFKKCVSLSEMVVPASAESIGDQAFYDCSGLATVTMNEGLKTIGNEVFWNNSGVMQFSIPGTVTDMGTNCFYGCTRTTYLTFRDGSETLTIDNSSCRSSIIEAKTTNSDYRSRYYDYFYDCPIRFLTLGRNLEYSYSTSRSIYDLNGNSFTKVTRASAPFVNKTDLRSVTIGNKVNFLWHHLLNGCENIAKIEFKPSVNTVYTYALANCTGLKNLDLSTGLKNVYDYAFSNCPNLSSLIFPNPLVQLGNGACMNDTGLTEVIFNEEAGNNLSFTIGESTFRNCPGLTSLTFPSKTTSIGNNCFYDTEFLTNIIFVDSNRAITLGYGANHAKSMTPDKSDTEIPLFGNSHLQSLYIGRNITYTASKTNGYSPFYYQTYLTDVRFSQSGTVTYCKDYLLFVVNNCKTLVLPQSLKTIGDYTFGTMSMLEGIDIPNSVTEIGKYAFRYDKALKYANLSTSCPWLKEGLFAHCDSLASITIPPVVTKMDKLMFQNCGQLAKVTFEDNTDVLEIGYGASQADGGLFWDCPVETLYLGRWLSYNTEKPYRSPFYAARSLKNLTFGEPVGVVDKYMFTYCSGLEEVYLPDNIESVGLWGFRGCSSLKNVRFSEKLSQISDYGFSECTSLDNVVFPASMTSIADNSFSNCTSLKKLDLGKSLMIIGPAAFKNDSALEGIEIPETLYGLGVEAFANCTSLPNVTIRAISSVGKQAFQGCSGLQWVSLSDKTTSLGEDSFLGCSGIKYVKSYAEFPPEGLVNFPEEVVADGTLFVPEYSMDYYQYSPTWENWYSIRPISDNILVSSVTLDIEEHSFKAQETIQLTATVGADDATDKNILWRTSDDAIATVDNTGKVTAVAVGDVTISAIAADGSGEKAECHIVVLPTMVESIALNGDANTIKKGRVIELNAVVLPSSATNNDIQWSSSNDAIAIVDTDGIVTAIAAGDVTITATAADGSDVTGTFALMIIPPTKGDSNDNDQVTITDAVNTANYAVGNEVADFCFEAADVNGDNRITLADASGTVTEVLNQPAVNVAMAVSRKIRSLDIADYDILNVADYSIESGKTASVDVNLDNTIDYVALQADIVVPEGMDIVGVEIGERVEANHSLMQRRIDDRTMRIALFDINNMPFAENDEAVIRIIIKSDNPDCGDIMMNNIIASDAEAHEYMLTAVGGHNTGLSGIDSISGDGAIKIEATDEGINIFNADGKEVRIYSVDGILLAKFIANGNMASRNVSSGVYIVAVDNTTAKVMVK